MARTSDATNRTARNSGGGEAAYSAAEHLDKMAALKKELERAKSERKVGSR